MNTIIQFHQTQPSIGLRTRKVTPGPELKLTQFFVKSIIDTFETGPGNKLAIFQEPYLESGYPDIVIAEYDPAIFRTWADTRSKLTVKDLKVLTHLSSIEGADGLTLSHQLGFKTNEMMLILTRLLSANLIELSSGECKARPVEEIYGIKKLIAIEAKIKNWSSVLLQAQSNKWFASETYILIPVDQPNSKVLEECEQFGIGIYLCNSQDVRKFSGSSLAALPTCYASWQFNEWIGRQIQLGTAEKNISTAQPVTIQSTLLPAPV